jgi:uncharacterized protein (DUF1810 family)
MSDPYELVRFVDAQERVYDQACKELRKGRKRSHWMWFVFPQVAGLGRSFMARRYEIGSLDEARAYLSHPILGPRLVECTDIVNAIEGKTLYEIFGTPDDLKFRSSMTLFAMAAPDTQVFRAALEKYCSGEEDPLTLAQLRRQ